MPGEMRLLHEIASGHALNRRGDDHLPIVAKTLLLLVVEFIDHYVVRTCLFKRVVDEIFACRLMFDFLDFFLCLLLFLI